MKHIIKTSSPAEFEDWKKFTKKTAVRNRVKESLLDEQGFICCYCQQHIELNEKTTIEHFVARNNDATKIFDYDNLLACCDGGQGERTEQDKAQEEVTPKYCGHAKENSNIAINPLDVNCETYFSYSFNPDSLTVSIESSSPEGLEAIETLNLNTQKLCNLRGKALEGFIFDENDDYISPEDAQALLSQIKQKQNGKFIPFCVALEHVLLTL